MKQSNRLSNFNDGYLVYGTTRSKVGKGNKLIGKEFLEQGTLFFEQLSLREQDYHFAQAMGKTLSIKLKTQYFSNINSKVDLAVNISNVNYEVIKVDSDKAKNYLFWHLSKVGEANV